MTRGKKPPPPFRRLATGVPQLDIILQGGILQGGSYIVAGQPGSGKTILANQICFNHVKAGGKAVYISLLSESHGRMLGHLAQLSFFDPEVITRTLHYVSGYDALRAEKLKGVVSFVRKLIKRHGATLLVFDGMTRLGSFASNTVEFKQFVHELNVLLEFTGCTALLLTDSSAEMDLGYPAKTMVDGLIELRDRLEGLRSVREMMVTKFRGSAFLRGAHFFDIDFDGLHFYPRVEARLATPSQEPAASKERLSLGISGLDRMTGGGLAEGTSGLVLGSSGTGKTLLGLHFLASGLASKEPSLYFGFFESPARLRKKGDDLGLKLSGHARTGLFEIVWQPAGELILDALAERLLDLVAEKKIKRLVIDGLAGFVEAPSAPERLTYFFKALTNELRALGVTTLLTVEMRELFGPDVKVPLLGLATVAENIVFLRQVEIASELRRAVAVMKTRENAHDDKVRELTITDAGLVVGDPFETEKEVLRGGASGTTGPASPRGKRGKGEP